MLGNYLQQTTSADDIFRCIFLGAFRVKIHSTSDILLLVCFIYIKDNALMFSQAYLHDIYPFLIDKDSH